MLGSDSGDPEREATRPRGATGTGATGTEEGVNEPIHYTNSTRASRQLPSGTGPGTTGKTSSRRMSHGANYDAQTEARNVQSEAAMQRDLERSRLSGDISGYGTDAAAAAGGSLSNSHQGAMAGHTYGEYSEYHPFISLNLISSVQITRPPAECRPLVTSPLPHRRQGPTLLPAHSVLARPPATTFALPRGRLPRPD